MRLLSRILPSRRTNPWSNRPRRSKIKRGAPVKIDSRVMLYAQASLAAMVVVGLNWMLAKGLPHVHIDSGAASAFFAVLGIVYAILIGFAIYMVASDYGDMRRCVYGEVNQLQNAWEYLSFVDDQPENVALIQESLTRYVEFILSQEWPLMGSVTELEIATPASLKSLMKAVNAIRITNQSDSVSLEKIMECLAAAERHRVDRLVASQQRLPSLVYHLVVLLSVIIVIIFSFLDIEDLGVNLALNGVNGFAIALLCLIIRDIDNPFRGAWTIEPTPFRSLLRDWRGRR